MKEKEKEIKSSDNKDKILDENDFKKLEKDIENYMRFKVTRNQKTSLNDPLNILTKEPKLIPIEKQIKKYKDNLDKNNSNKKIKLKRYDSGFEINYILDKNNQLQIISINKDSMEEKIIQNLESALDSNLELYIKKLFCKLNYSPIIKKIFGKKITFSELEELAILWRFYVELKIPNDENSITEFRNKLFKIMTDNIKLIIRHIFSIMRIREAIYSIQNVYQIHCFNILKRDEIKNKEKAFDMRIAHLDPNKEVAGNGACFILIKELKRALNMLLYSPQYLFYSFETIFNNDFNFLYKILNKMFYDFFIHDCFFSTLLYNMKAIFIRSDMKEVCNEIDNLTLPFENEFKNQNKKVEDLNIQFKDSGKVLFDFKECFNQLGYSVDENDEKGEEIIIETEEEKKVNEMKDIDELLKYIEGDSSKKKKKKKKKKKDNPINILDKLKKENKIIDDDNLSQSSFSVISHDSIVSGFKRDLKEDTIDNNYDKIKPNFSEDFISKFD